MMGWIMLAGIAAFTGLLLWAIGFPVRLWTVAATALTLGATGYAWQGSPGLPGHSALTAEKTGEVDPGMVALREAFFGRFNASYSEFARADAMIQGGSPDAAVKVMRAAANRMPGDAGIWTGLGLTLAEHDRGVSPASRLAFDRAMQVWPQNPGPPFFLGYAYARMGAFVEAKRWWTRALELSPPDAEYRAVIADWLARVDAEIARQSGQPLPAQSPSPTATPVP